MRQLAKVELWRRLERGLSTGRLIDEICLAICPAVDGAKGAPSIFDSSDRDCRRIGADHLDEAGEYRGAGGRRGLAPLSAPKPLMRSSGRR
jgi:hypothetical protein